MTERLIFTDLAGNNNKFWHGEVVGDVCKTNWGRVGAVGQFKDYPCGSPGAAQRKLDSLVSSKLAKGYTRQFTVGKDAVVQVKSAAKIEIDHKNDPETQALIDFLVQRNIHKIESLTTIRYDAGRLTTPLGPVTPEGIDEAERLLTAMTARNADLGPLANAYLRIVPRDFGRHRVDPRDLFGLPAQIKAELDMLDALRAVVKSDDDQKVVTFETKLHLVHSTGDDREEFRRINAFFKAGVNRMHASSKMELHRVWRMEIAAMSRAFNAGVGNIRELWHGTKDSNLLSILKGGYIIPRQGGSVAITGRMFGDGVYFSDQATKSLNYASASAPGQYGQQASKRCFMLLNDVAMGREYKPTRSFSGLPPSGFDSCFAEAGKSSVMNNEMIVYKTNQINPRFLCEFR